MIITCKKKIPLHWLLLTIMPWASWMFVMATMGTVSLYSLKKFVENPAGLTFIMSLPGFASMLLGPVVSFMSDRIWTRYGRRKPFVLFAWSLGAICVALMPLMPNFWLLLGAYLLFYIAADFQGPQEPLKLEVIPPQQRGRAVAAVSWMVQLGLLLFFFVAFGRFDDQQFLLGFPLTGEETIYWSASASMLVMVMFIALGIKEVDPKSPVRGERLNVRNLFKGIFARDLWPVYSLIFASAMLGAGLGTLGNLLYTDQWRFTKQEMGNNIAIGGIINLCIIPVLGIFADRWNRVRAYQTLIILSILINFSFYLYVNFILHDRRPNLLELVLFGEALSILGILTSMAFTPMVFDYVPRNEMGTYMAGQNLLQRLTGLLTLNGVGLFVWGYSTLFMPAAGDMTRVVLRETISQSALASKLDQATWLDPVSGQPRASRDLEAEPWYATGAVLDYGRCHEIRLINPSSAALRADRDKQEGKRAALAKDEAALLERLRRLRADPASSPTKIAALGAEAETLNAQIAPLITGIALADAELARRGEALRAQVALHLQPLLLQPGEQILAAALGQATELEFPITNRIRSSDLEKLLPGLRREHSELIDLRPTRIAETSGYALLLSLQGNPSPERLAAISQSLVAQAHRRFPDVIPAGTRPVRTTSATLFSMDLVTIEDPLDLHPSPVTRIVTAVQGLFTDVPGPERRITALGRGLRQPGGIEHIKVEALKNRAENDHAIRILAVLPPAPASSDAPLASPAPEVVARFRTLFAAAPASPHTPEIESALLDLYVRSLDAGREQRTTIAEPLTTSGYVPMKYDYMSGYLWMLILSLVGLVVTILFIRREKRGEIRKRGLEEALAP